MVLPLAKSIVVLSYAFSYQQNTISKIYNVPTDLEKFKASIKKFRGKGESGKKEREKWRTEKEREVEEGRRRRK